MSQAGPSRFSKSFKVAATVSAYRVVSHDTATSAEGYVRVIQVPTITSQILGVSQDYADTTSAQFQSVPVLSFGYAKIMAGASVSAGAILVAVTATAYAIESAYSGAFNTSTAAFNTTGTRIPRTLGIALQKATASDTVIECLLQISNINVVIS